MVGAKLVGRVARGSAKAQAPSIFPFARAALTACLPFCLSAVISCGDGGGGSGGTSGSANSGTSGSGASGATNAGSAGKGGASSSGGSSTQGGEPSNGGGGGGSGGASGSGSGGSTGGKAGGANIEPGEPCTANCPTGTIHSCMDNCPFGACDEAGFFAGEPCSTYYPSPISTETVFCAKDQTATYCLTAIDGDISYYIVSCAAGTPTVTKCKGGCGVDSNHDASCNE